MTIPKITPEQITQALLIGAACGTDLTTAMTRLSVFCSHSARDTRTGAIAARSRYEDMMASLDKMGCFDAFEPLDEGRHLNAQGIIRRTSIKG